MNIDTSQLLSSTEAAKLVGLSTDSLHYYASQGRGPNPVTVIGGRALYSRDGILQWAKTLVKRKPGRKPKQEME
jgi:DNA-binding transcriptional MerR regulator